MSSSHERVLACSDCIINNSSSMTKVKLAEYVHSGSLKFVPFYFFYYSKIVIYCILDIYYILEMLIKIRKLRTVLRF